MLTLLFLDTEIRRQCLLILVVCADTQFDKLRISTSSETAEPSLVQKVTDVAIGDGPIHEFVMRAYDISFSGTNFMYLMYFTWQYMYSPLEANK